MISGPLIKALLFVLSNRTTHAPELAFSSPYPHTLTTLEPLVSVLVALRHPPFPARGEGILETGKLKKRTLLFFSD